MRAPLRWSLIAAPLVLLAAILISPTLLAGPAARLLERRFGLARDGRLEIGSLEPAWFGPQSARDVRLLDPSGEGVLDASVELPSLLDLLRASGREFGALTVTATADLVEDDTGVTNLERALRPVEVDQPGGELPRAPDDEVEQATDVAFDLTVSFTRLSWSDARTRLAGGPRVFSDVRVRVVGAPDGALEVRGEGLPTGLVDAVLGQDGLLVEVLGAELELTFRGRLPLEGQPLSLALESSAASLTFNGSLQDGALVARGDDALRASVPLGPLLGERVVGPLLPVVVGLRKPEGAAPIDLSVSSFHLPLDGDLSALDADVTLALGEVAYQLLPGLQDVLARIDQENVQRLAELEPLHVPIRGGVATYDGLVLEVGGHELIFAGSCDLASTELGLATSVPLKIFGSSLARELDRAREYLDPELAIPIELSGSWKRPRVRVGEGFLEEVLEQAARRTLSRGLMDLLDR